MPFEEKMTWVGVVVGFLVPAVYFATVLPQLGGTPASEVPYQWPLVVAAVASVVLIVAGSVATAVGTAVTARVTGRSPVDDIERRDERDVLIGRRGDAAGYYVASTGAVVALVITMLDYERFWIANSLYLFLSLAWLITGSVKLLAYRRGL